MSKSAERKGQRLFIDTTGPFPKSRAGNKYFHCTDDDFTDYAWVYFTNTKNSMPTFVEDLMKLMDGKGIKVTTPFLKPWKCQYIPLLLLSSVSCCGSYYCETFNLLQIFK